MPALTRTEQLTTSLERQLALVLDSPDEDVIFEAFRMLGEVMSEPLLAPHVRDMLREADRIEKEFRRTERELLREARRILDVLYRVEPAVERPDIEGYNADDPPYLQDLRLIESCLFDNAEELVEELGGVDDPSVNTANWAASLRRHELSYRTPQEWHRAWIGNDTRALPPKWYEDWRSRTTGGADPARAAGLPQGDVQRNDNALMSSFLKCGLGALQGHPAVISACERRPNGTVVKLVTDWKVMMSRSDIAFELYRGRSRTHPGRAAALLVGYHQEAYPRSSRTPQSAPLGAFDGIQAAEADLEVASLIERLVGRSGGQQEWQDHVNKALRSEPDPTFASLLKRYMRRVVNDLIIRLGRTLSMQELISRFRIRAMWYDKSRLRELANTVPEGNVNLRSEDNLTKELAMYLFDQGHPVLIKADIENVQLDLLGLGTPILVESKITRRGTRAVRNELIRGVAQLHAYMVNLEHSAQHVEEAFYVVFRLEGPIFELPSVFRTSRFVIYPVVIDVGTSETSGRNQALPSPIALEELRAELEKPAPPT